ncbi:MAG: hypothetical protein FWG98_14595 [Candidatus Cloacimonetes bacterium]|nr:hypothetical protein [Candidatus Cloacimonadota bacterium]
MFQKVLAKQYLKSIYIIIFFYLFIIDVNAAWIDNLPVTLSQPDQRQIEAFQSGDEFHRWIHNENGFTIILDPISDYWCWAIENLDGFLESTGYPVHLYTPESRGISVGENISHERYLEMRQEHDEKFNSNTIKAPSIGEVNSITIFISFPDDFGNDFFPAHYDFYYNFFNAKGDGERSMLRGHFLLSLRSNLRVTIPPARRCEVPSCYSHEAISVSLPSPHIYGAVQETLSLRKGSQNYYLPSARH